MRLEFAGIRRKTEFSPNHEVNDLLIINQTAEILRQMGAEVNLYDEDGLDKEIVKENLIFSMVQGPKGIDQLLKLSKKQPLIINSPESVYSCYRSNMLKLLPDGGIPIPKSLIVATDITMNGEMSQFSSPKIWVKRSDVHAVRQGDVTFVDLEEEILNCTLKDFKSRQIEKVILQEHIQGDTVKFYAVRETNFFFWYYTDKKSGSVFIINRLKELANAASEILGLYIYGGDAIISPDGSITIIDINDWPSFAPIRDEASKHISQLLYRKAEEYVNRS
ncbi:MAG: hypothetical protein ACM34K_18780 [Bacillota bacterium]